MEEKFFGGRCLSLSDLQENLGLCISRLSAIERGFGVYVREHSDMVKIKLSGIVSRIDECKILQNAIEATSTKGMLAATSEKTALHGISIRGDSTRPGLEEVVVKVIAELDATEDFSSRYLEAVMAYHKEILEYKETTLSAMHSTLSRSIKRAETEMEQAKLATEHAKSQTERARVSVVEKQKAYRDRIVEKDRVSHALDSEKGKLNETRQKKSQEEHKNSNAKDKRTAAIVGGSTAVASVFAVVLIATGVGAPLGAAIGMGAAGSAIAATGSGIAAGIANDDVNSSEAEITRLESNIRLLEAQVNNLEYGLSHSLSDQKSAEKIMEDAIANLNALTNSYERSQEEIEKAKNISDQISELEERASDLDENALEDLKGLHALKCRLSFFSTSIAEHKLILEIVQLDAARSSKYLPGSFKELSTIMDTLKREITKHIAADAKECCPTPFNTEYDILA